MEDKEPGGTGRGKMRYFVRSDDESRSLCRVCTVGIVGGWLIRGWLDDCGWLMDC